MTLKYSLKYSLMVLILLGMMACLSSCGKDDGPNATTVQLNKLSATWNIGSVQNDGVNVTSQYTGFKLTIDEQNYTTQNGGNPWPSSGTYEFDGTDLMSLIRSDNAEISIDEITDNSLILSFNFNSVSEARVDGITGDFTFSLTK